MVPAIFANWGGKAVRPDQHVKPLPVPHLGMWHHGLARTLAARAGGGAPRGGQSGAPLLTFASVPPPPVRVAR